ncbi:hypothetical protein [Dankookia sp. P2]|uniref:hypothetical protein n=1 Tax=Dankookia sp. P2 TaxID=3423955 RepID=UPI003D6691D3
MVETAAHAADLGLTFYDGRQFPDAYRGALIGAQHGSWNRTTPAGARILVTFLNQDGTVREQKPFAEGWLDEKTNEYLGRPVDVALLRDGSMLASGDMAAAIPGPGRTRPMSRRSSAISAAASGSTDR